MTEPSITREQVEWFLLEKCISTEKSAVILDLSVSRFRDLVATRDDAPQPIRHMGVKSAKYVQAEIEAFAAQREAVAKVAAAKKASRGNRTTSTDNAPSRAMATA